MSLTIPSAARLRAALFALAFVFIAAPLGAVESNALGRHAIRATRLIALEQSALIAHPSILIEGERIVAVSADGVAPDGIPVRDLGDLSVLPGPIDLHVHITSGPGGIYETPARRSPIDDVVRAHFHARR